MWSPPSLVAKEEIQLVLDLFDGLPWGGRSPRVLTRGHLGLIFKAQADRARVIPDRMQLDLFPATETAFKKRGRSAPTLLPLPF